jgi:formimidoylglutamate deiminase
MTRAHSATTAGAALMGQGMPTVASPSPPSSLWAPHAWVQGRWQAQVLLRIDALGRWCHVQAGVATPPEGATVLAGPVLPGLVNAHSHAFQRAFAGLAERREQASDTFWSWRDRMYRVAERITPEQLRAVARQLYLELLQGGYTQVCEFHYLQHAPDGRPYGDPHTLAWALADAASDIGIGLTLLPVLYERAGFKQPALRDDQRRFAADARGVWAAHQAVTARAAAARLAATAANAVPDAGAASLLNAGVAIHSLRAAAPESIHLLKQLADTMDGPLHIHVAEQTAEVDDCLAATGQRPLEWLAREGVLDKRWQLVHATHSTPAEIEAVARTGAGVVICPSTEANLGDGFCDLPGWLQAGVPISLGSDSHVTRCAAEELRWLEYGQRLRLRQRNVAAAPEQGEPATAHRLWQRCLDGGAAAAGLKSWGLVAGARADLLVLDAAAPSLLGVPEGRWLDALVFSSPGAAFRDVMVAGRWVVQGHRHWDQGRVAGEFERAMVGVWGA